MFCYIRHSVLPEHFHCLLFVGNFAIILIKWFIQYISYVLFKVGLSPSKSNCVICFIETPLKRIENAFYFTLKVFFALKIFNFLL